MVSFRVRTVTNINNRPLPEQWACRTNNCRIGIGMVAARPPPPGWGCQWPVPRRAGLPMGAVEEGMASEAKYAPAQLQGARAQPRTPAPFCGRVQAPAGWADAAIAAGAYACAYECVHAHAHLRHLRAVVMVYVHGMGRAMAVWPRLQPQLRASRQWGGLPRTPGPNKHSHRKLGYTNSGGKREFILISIDHTVVV